MLQSGNFRSHLLTFVLCAGIALAWLLFLLGQGDGLPKLGKADYRATALVPAAAAVTPGARVTMAGVSVGTIQSVKHSAVGAAIDLKFKDDRVTPLPVDSRVELRQHTPVGENYVSIIRGRSSRMLPSGGSIPVSQAKEYVDVDTLLSTLRGETRTRARQLLQGLGGALRGRGGELNQTVGRGASTILNLAQLVDIVHDDRRQTAQLVEQLGDISSAVGERDEAITTIAQRGLTGLRAVADRDQALGNSIKALPQTMTRLRQLAGTLQDTSRRASPVLANLTTAVRDVRPAVQALPAAARDGRAIARDLGAAAPGLQDTLAGIKKLSPSLSAALPTLRTTTCQLNPMLGYLKPRMDGFMGIVIGLASASNSYDATGHLIRLAPVLGDNSLAGLPDSVERASQTLLHSGLLSKSTALSWDAYPRQEDQGRYRADPNGPIGPSEVTTKTDYKYPRVEADC
jgi:virulence factor Mce-like protein